MRRFTESAKRTVFYAQQEAERMGANHDLEVESGERTHDPGECCGRGT